MSGECKDHTGGVSGSVIRSVVDRLYGYQSKINMIVVNQLSNSDLRNSAWKRDVAVYAYS